MSHGRDFATRGAFARAEWALTQVVRYGEPSPTALFELARVQQERGKLTLAKEHLARALELKPDFYLGRRLFFEICRQEYWTVTPSLMERVDTRLASTDSPELRLRRLHLRAAMALFPQLRYEAGRLDDEIWDVPIFERLEKKVVEGPRDRLGRRLLVELESARLLLEQLPEELRALRSSLPRPERQLACLRLRGGDERWILALRDADDLIGHFLEVITGGHLTFVPFHTLRKVRFASRSDYVDGIVTLHDGQTCRIVCPLTYYGSRESTLEEIRAGEFTILQVLHAGVQIGLGRRLLAGQDAQTGEPINLAFHEVESIEFSEIDGDEL